MEEIQISMQEDREDREDTNKAKNADLLLLKCKWPTGIVCVDPVMWYLHCTATVVLREQLNFKSAVIKSKRYSCFIVTNGNSTLMFFYMGINSIRAENLSPLVLRILNKKS